VDTTAALLLQKSTPYSGGVLNSGVRELRSPPVWSSIGTILTIHVWKTELIRSVVSQK
jgi:hypothetical protein